MDELQDTEIGLLDQGPCNGAWILEGRIAETRRLQSSMKAGFLRDSSHLADDSRIP
jgi:hypothetical protein